MTDKLTHGGRHSAKSDMRENLIKNFVNDFDQAKTVEQKASVICALLGDYSNGTDAKITKLAERSKAGVFLRINAHKIYYDTAKAAIDELSEDGENPSDEIKNEIIKRDMLVDLQFYPDSPGGFFRIIHYDIDMALDQAFECIAEREAIGRNSEENGPEDQRGFGKV